MSSKHVKGGFDGKYGLSVNVRGGNVDGALRLFNRKVKREKIMKELRDRTYYKKPSVKRRMKKIEAVIRARKNTPTDI